LQAVVPGNAATHRLAALLTPRPTPVALAATPPSLPPLTAPVTGQGTPAVPPTAVTRAAIVSDPLAPRYSNYGRLSPAAAAAARRRNGTMIPGTPVRGLPTAGYVRDSYPEPPAAKPAAPDG
jgi:hypothetical protein